MEVRGWGDKEERGVRPGGSGALMALVRHECDVSETLVRHESD